MDAGQANTDHSKNKIIIKKEGGKMAKTAKRKSSGSAIVMEKKIPFWKFVLHHKGLYLMLLPGLLYFIIFRYIPMAGIIIAFQNYSPFKGIFGSQFVGWQN